MIELTTALLGAAIASCIWSVLEQRRCRQSLESARSDLASDREVLAKAAQANETLGLELARQRDQLASLEMRSTGAPPRGFGPGR